VLIIDYGFKYLFLVLLFLGLKMQGVEIPEIT